MDALPIVKGEDSVSQEIIVEDDRKSLECEAMDAENAKHPVIDSTELVQEQPYIVVQDPVAENIVDKADGKSPDAKAFTAENSEHPVTGSVELGQEQPCIMDATLEIKEDNHGDQEIGVEIHRKSEGIESLDTENAVYPVIGSTESVQDQSHGTDSLPEVLREDHVAKEIVIETDRKSPDTKTLDAENAENPIKDSGQLDQEQTHAMDALPDEKGEDYASQEAVTETERKCAETKALGNENAEDPITTSSNELVVYNSPATNTCQDIVMADSAETPPSKRLSMSSRGLPSIGAFTVQCAKCFKWRLIPTKEKYEEIRETIIQNPFFCEQAREWHREVSCDDPTDISQDGSRIWAIDKPNIARPPPGWERLLRIRGEGGTRFADVYYCAPCGKKLRSTVEVERYLSEHPEYEKAGVTLSRFSFQIPRPLRENYVRKRPPPSRPVNGSDDLGSRTTIEPDEVRPIAWVSPPSSSNHDNSGLGLSLVPPFDHSHNEQLSGRKRRKKAEVFSNQMFRNQTYDQQKVEVEDYSGDGNASPF